MTNKKTVCLLNDSFPPQIDGVSAAVLNYALNIEKNGMKSIVVTPSYPKSEDEKYPFAIARYPSVNFKKVDQYMMGIPFSPRVAKRIDTTDISIIHSHCPVMSTIMARELRQIAKAPIVFTYHTKFDIEVNRVTESKTLRKMAKKALAANISACNEVWVVSNGAGENLRALGYEGDYIVMPNGVDLPRMKISEEKIHEATKDYNIPENIPVYLYVGRIMWYKGTKITLDALAKLKNDGKDFRMFFIGGGDDLEAIKNYTKEINLDDKCIFTGPIRDRQILSAWYARADLFLFPSTFDTNGLVVREAAACNLGSVLIKGSCAAEDVTDGQNAFLIEENAESMYAMLTSLYGNFEKMRQIGENASNEIYISWEDSVKAATERYEIVIDKYKCGENKKRITPSECLAKTSGGLMKGFSKLVRKKKIMGNV